jgi:predicted DsbA family dithiol-disulfide isomerase
LCPWCYIGKTRLEKAIRLSHVKAEVEWKPFELYVHQDTHRIHREHVHGHEHLDAIYRQIATIAAEEHLVVRQHSYEHSSRRALTGILFARTHGKIDEYIRDVYAEVFEYGNDVSSLMVLGRIALKLGWNVEDFLRFVDEKHNQDQMVHESETARHSGVHGVPTYHINGHTLAGTIPAPELAEILRAHAHPLPAPHVGRAPPKKKNVSFPTPARAPKKKLTAKAQRPAQRNKSSSRRRKR